MCFDLKKHVDGMQPALTQENRNEQPRRGKSGENAVVGNHGEKSQIAVLALSSDLKGKCVFALIPLITQQRHKFQAVTYLQCTEAS